MEKHPSHWTNMLGGMETKGSGGVTNLAVFCHSREGGNLFQ
jgi:hypothetical protein